MKKQITKIGLCLSVIVLATIGVKTVNTKQISSMGLIFSNMEALANDNETTLAKECYDRYDSYGRKSTRVRICETCDFATVFNPKKNTICPK